MRTVLRLARRGIALELALYRSLFRWVTRRPDVPAGGTPFHYVGAVAVLLWAFIIVSAVELVVVHLLLPWETVRLAADVLGIWGLLWMLGYAASLTVHPHVATGAGLRVRYGTAVDVTIPWDAVAATSTRERSRDTSRTVQVDRGDGGTVLNVVVGSRTNVDVTLRTPVEVALPKGPDTVVRVRLYADDPRALAAQVRRHLTPTSPQPSSR